MGCIMQHCSLQAAYVKYFQQKQYSCAEGCSAKGGSYGMHATAHAAATASLAPGMLNRKRDNARPARGKSKTSAIGVSPSRPTMRRQVRQSRAAGCRE